MNTIKAVQSSALSLALVACVQGSNIVESPSLVPVGPKFLASNSLDTPRLTLDVERLDQVGFNHRQSTSHSAYFVDSDQIAAMHPRTIADVFRHVPVLLESPFSYRNRLLLGPTPCFSTYVDGLLRPGKGPSSLDTFMRVQDVIGAEVYPSGQLPPPPFGRAGSDESCTTVAIWTRPPRI
jgi:hypothetical protein